MYLENLSKRFGNTAVMDNFSMEIPQKKITCILGPSGCGKTSLLNIICNLEKPDSGKIIFDSKNQTFSYLFQEPRLMPWLTSLENVAAALGGDKKTAKDYLCMLGLEDSLNKFPSQLSGGMKQRVSMARAFGKKSDIILMDEPFQSLDLALQNSLRKQFFSIWEKYKRTVVWVTHDITEACLSADRIVCFGGRPLTVKMNTDVKNPRSEENIKNMSQTISELYEILTNSHN